ncbi:hypothetical protein BKA61DRAFT_208170 [Leptodontidium sp. MPI-SDFR-AT-0119]|nr:hypothetical protein BKA61DRAFT_208170 [Leptodontidium sp. MPI-SDFR-AT-0119]
MSHTESTQDMGLQSGSPDTIDRRKARKRESDRISQQRKRKKDREAICKLKAQVKALKHGSDDNHVYNLILGQEKDQEKIKRHLERVKQIEALVKADLKDLGEDDDQTPAGTLIPNSVIEAENLNDTHPYSQIPTSSKHSNMPSFNPSPACGSVPPVVDHPGSHLDAMRWEELTDGVHTSPNGASDNPSPEEYMYLEDISACDQDLTNGTSVHLLELPSLSLPLDSLHMPDLSVQDTPVPEGTLASQGDDCHNCDSMWTVCDTAIVQARGSFLSSGNNSGFGEDDAHIIITAITEGWARAAKSKYWNNHWDSLRQIDQFCLAMSGPLERMTSLYNLIRFFKYQRFPGDPLAIQLPAFLHARPSQLNIPHTPVVDHFIWPGFREHLVFGHRKYNNNTFANDYGRSVRFLWPYELRDTYLKSRQTGLYRFSGDYIQRADDIQCYTMTMQFLCKYPEFQGDVPVFDPAPGMIHALGGSRATFCHFPVPNGALEEVEEMRRITA